MESLISIYYKKYKKYLIPAGIFLISAFLFYQVAMNQILSIIETRKNIDTEKAKIQQLTYSYNSISKVKNEDLDKDLSVVKTALPDSKDILSIYLGLLSASTRANIQMNNFSFKMGNIYETTKSKKTASLPKTNLAGAPFIEVSVKGNSGSAKNLAKFSDELYKVLPIAEIKTMNISGSSGNYELVFYYKPYDLALLSKQDNVKLLNQQQEILLKQLEEFGK